MVRDALSSYLTLASGLTEVTRQRARAAAKALVTQSGATVEQVSSLAEEILQTSRANRTALMNLVRYEVEHTFSRLGLASTEEVAALRQRVANLEQALGQQSATAAEAGGPAEAAEVAGAAKAASAKEAGTEKKTATPAKTAGGTAGTDGGAEEQE
jgi:polyhydroxyalkanoate synthesis regulator phasin